MQLKDIFSMLSHGELRKLATGGSNASGILEADYPKVIGYINLGLADLHKRFQLKTRQLVVQQTEGIAKYNIHPRHSITNTSSTAPKYIIDSPYDIYDDENEVLKIVGVYAENGKEYSINDETDKYSVFTPTDRSLVIPFADPSNAVSVVCRTNHPYISLEETDNTIDIDLSIGYIEPLLLYVGSRAAASVGKQDTTIMSQDLLARYEKMCFDIEKYGIETTDETTNLKLEMNQWP